MSEDLYTQEEVDAEVDEVTKELRDQVKTYKVNYEELLDKYNNLVNENKNDEIDTDEEDEVKMYKKLWYREVNTIDEQEKKIAKLEHSLRMFQISFNEMCHLVKRTEPFENLPNTKMLNLF